MRRALHAVRKLGRACLRPSLVGAAYVLVLALFAAQAPIVAEGDRALGAQAEEVSAFVTTRFGGEIRSLVVAIGATAIAAGLILGAFAGVLVQLRQLLLRRAFLSGPALAFRALVVVIVVHAWLFVHAMARSPQLYADAWYARGGVRRAVQVVVTDVLGPHGTVLLAFLMLGAWTIRKASIAAHPRASCGHWRDRDRRPLDRALA